MLCASAVTAQAALVTILAEGTVTGSSEPTVTIGSSGRFELVYETSVPDTNSSIDLGVFLGAFVSASARFGIVDLVATGVRTLNVRDRFEDSLVFESTEVGSIFGPRTGFHLGLIDFSGSVFASDALPTALDLSAFNSARISARDDTAASANIDTLTVTVVTPVPVPAGGAVLLGGLGAAALLRRRRA